MERTKTNELVYSDEYYWENRWKTNEIDFHKKVNHEMLVRHFNKMTEGRSSLRFFFPLCGKEVDMCWVASLGHVVVGVEFVQDAVESFFIENKLEFNFKELEYFKLYSSKDERIRIYCGDFFKFTTELEEPFDCVWDRGALVALPLDLRIKFAENVQKFLKPHFRYLLDAFEYDKNLYPGPPHVVTLDELIKLYGLKCDIKLIDSGPYRLFSESLKNSPPKELVFLLTNKE